jgi:uncharacterized membrane protein YdbT with pleckstrin-like domain
MFRNRPIFFLLLFFLVPAGISLFSASNNPIFLLLSAASFFVIFFWWINCLQITLTLTPDGIIYRKGIIAKHTNEISHSHVRLIRIDQGVLQRIMNVGTISIASAGIAEVEIVIRGMANPEKIKRIVEANRPLVQAGGFSTRVQDNDARSNKERRWRYVLIVILILVASVVYLRF